MSNTFYKVGEKYFIRTISNYFTGKLIDVNEKELLLSDAAWIPETARFSTSLKEGIFNEIEPYFENVIINKDAIVDASIWSHDLPRTQK